MPVLDGGIRRPESRKPRTTLTVRDSEIEKLLSGLAVDSETLAELRAFGKALWSARSRWDVERRQRERQQRVGLFGPAVRT
jgi:hypothetical protein